MLAVTVVRIVFGRDLRQADTAFHRISVLVGPSSLLLVDLSIILGFTLPCSSTPPHHLPCLSPSSRTSLATIGLLSIFPAAVLSQTSAFTDQATGIQFQRFFGARTNFGFGMALSTDTTSKSFIGQLTFPLSNGNGWGGWSLTGDMEGPLLMAAWYAPLIFHPLHRAMNLDPPTHNLKVRRQRRRGLLLPAGLQRRRQPARGSGHLPSAAHRRGDLGQQHVPNVHFSLRKLPRRWARSCARDAVGRDGMGAGQQGSQECRIIEWRAGLSQLGVWGLQGGHCGGEECRV